jgi:hypothetical protein
MSKLILSLGAIIALTAILLIPSAFNPIHIAKASTCSASNGHNSKTQSTSGSCASITFASHSAWLKPTDRRVVGGSQSSCNSGSIAVTGNGVFGGLQGFSNNGAVSCSSSSP